MVLEDVIKASRATTTRIEATPAEEHKEPIVCVCVCVCVREREREKPKEKEREAQAHSTGAGRAEANRLCLQVFSESPASGGGRTAPRR